MGYGFLFYDLQYLLLAVLAFPLLAAGAAWTAGRFGLDAARRTAAWAAAIHLTLTIVLAFFAGTILGERGRWGDSGRSEPIAVVGDPGMPQDQLGQRSITHATSWTLLSLAPPPTEPGMPRSDVEFYVGLDGLNLLLIALSSLMTFLAVMVSWESVTDKAGGYYAWLFLLQAAIIGAFSSFDIILFYVFFELTLVPAFFLIGRWGGGGGRRDAARKFFLYTLLGGLLTLTGIIGVVATNPVPVNPFTADPATAGRNYNPLFADPAAPGEMRQPARGPVTFSIPRLMGNHGTWSRSVEYLVQFREARLRQKLTPPQRQAAEASLAEAKAERDRFHTTQMWLFLALMAGFAVKMPLVPFHTWLPAAYAEAPLAVTMLLSSLLAKLGTFGIIRVVLPLTPEATVEYGLPGVGVLAAIGIVYAAFCAYAQRDLKLLVAYSSISHLGFLALGLFSLTQEGVAGGVLHMVNHGLTVGGLFAVLGFLADRYRTLDAGQYGGLWAKFPRYTFFVMVLGLASIGLPGLNNFVSEMLMLAGLFDPRNLATAGWGFGAVAAAGVFLSAWYTLTMIRRVFFGPLREPPAAVAPVPGLTTREVTTFGVLAACCLALGLLPQPVLDVIRPDANRISFERELPRPAPTLRQGGGGPMSVSIQVRPGGGGPGNPANPPPNPNAPAPKAGPLGPVK
jgi:NADH-quinone oxidoreductase subunit M